MHAKEEIEMNEFQIEDPQELSIEEQISEKMKPQISNSELKAIIRFTVLYFVIGIPAGFYASLTLLLQGSGISSGQMAFWVTDLFTINQIILVFIHYLSNQSWLPLWIVSISANLERGRHM